MNFAMTHLLTEDRRRCQADFPAQSQRFCSVVRYSGMIIRYHTFLMIRV